MTSSDAPYKLLSASEKGTLNGNCAAVNTIGIGNHRVAEYASLSVP